MPGCMREHARTHLTMLMSSLQVSSSGMLEAFGGGARAKAVPPLTLPSTRTLPSPSTPAVMAVPGMGISPGAGTASRRSKQGRGRRRQRVRPEGEGGVFGPAVAEVPAVQSGALRVRPGSASTLASARYAASLGVPQTVRGMHLEDLGACLSAGTPGAMHWQADGDDPEGTWSVVGLQVSSSSSWQYFAP